MSDENEDVAPEETPGGMDLGKILAEAIGLDEAELKRQAEEMREKVEKFPEHAKVMMLRDQIHLIHLFVHHFLSDHGLYIANRDGTPYEETPETPHEDLLEPKFFGIDMVAFDAEEPLLRAYEHDKQSEYEAEHGDPKLMAQMDEFEALLADMEDAPSASE